MASRLHEEVGEFLRTSPLFKFQELHQEYSISKLNYFHPNPRLRYDWAIPNLLIVIECQGEQHYTPVQFGGVDYEEALQDFQEGQVKDKEKEEAALLAGWTLIKVPYTALGNVAQVFESYLAIGEQEASKYTDIERPPEPQEDPRVEVARQYKEEKHRQFLKSPKHQEALQEAKRKRHERYQQHKLQLTNRQGLTPTRTH
jgi:glucan-binding YG repeat protein